MDHALYKLSPLVLFCFVFQDLLSFLKWIVEKGKKHSKTITPIHHLLSLFLFILIYFKKCQGRLHQESKTRWCPQNFSVSLKRSKQISSSFAFILSFSQFSGWCTSQTKRFRLICSYFTHVFEFICYLNSHCVCFTENLLRRRLELNDVSSCLVFQLSRSFQHFDPNVVQRTHRCTILIYHQNKIFFEQNNLLLVHIM